MPPIHFLMPCNEYEFVASVEVVVLFAPRCGVPYDEHDHLAWRKILEMEQFQHRMEVFLARPAATYGVCMPDTDEAA